MIKAIVFDSSTLILLAKISLLRDATTKAKCIVTGTVIEECTRKDSYDSKIIKELVKEKHLKIMRIKPKGLAKIIDDFNIQEGEASSLALAIKKKCILATDDKPAIKACTILNADFSTALHFVVRLYKRGLFDKGLALEKISSLEKYGRYSSRIIEDAKNRIEGD